MRPVDYRAPSWSWLSVEGRIGFININYSYLDHLLLRVDDVKTALAADNKFGPIKSAALHVQGMLAPATWKIREVSANKPTIDVYIDKKKDGDTHFFLDEPTDLVPPDVYLLPVTQR